MELEGRVALVTGSTGRGMGRSMALTLAREGADLVLNYETRPQRAEAVRRRIEAMGRRVVLQQADVSTEAGANALVDAAVGAFGRVDILIVSAGGAWQPRDFADIPAEHWRKVLAEELDAPLYLIPRVLPGMRERRWGRVILIGGYEADAWPLDAPLDYPLGKAGRHWLARTLGPRELHHGITVNAVAPAHVPYVELDDALADLAHGEEYRARAAPRPQDAAEVVAFLCSERARFVTASVINVVTPEEPPSL